MSCRSAVAPMPIAFIALITACHTERGAAPQDLLAANCDASLDRSDLPWSGPVLLGPEINSPAAENNARPAPDGLSLYFSSTRGGNFDIWVSRRTAPGCPWQPARNLGPSINTPGVEAGAAFTPDGRTMFFFGDDPDGFGDTDILFTRREDPSDDLSWGEPVNLGPVVNTAGHESTPAYVQAEGQGGVLYFHRGSLPDVGVYAVPVTREGLVRGPAVRIEADMETISADGREAFFWAVQSGGVGQADLWTTTRRSVHHPWSEARNLGRPVNSPFADLNPGLSHDGLTLYFSSGQARGGFGLQDVWMTTRGSTSPEQPADCP